MKVALSDGIALAAMAGLLVGGAMKLGPDALDRDVSGPQILVSGENTRDNRNDWSGTTNFTRYIGGEIPEYVLGTDWTRPVELDYIADLYLYEDLYAEAAAAPEPVVENAVFVAPVKVSTPPPVPRPVSIPSRDGDILSGVKDDAPVAPTLVATAPADDETQPS